MYQFNKWANILVLFDSFIFISIKTSNSSFPFICLPPFLRNRKQTDQKNKKNGNVHNVYRNNYILIQYVAKFTPASLTVTIFYYLIQYAVDLYYEIGLQFPLTIMISHDSVQYVMRWLIAMKNFY